MKYGSNEQFWKRNKTKKEYGLQINLGEQIKENIGNFRRFSVLYRNNHYINNIGNKEESKNYNDSSSSSSDEDNSDYYNNFLKRLNENEENEKSKKILNTPPKKSKHSIISKPKIHRSSILKNKKFRTKLRKSLLKHSKENEINKIINNNNIYNINNNNNNNQNNEQTNFIKLTPINEEKSIINNNIIKNINKDNKLKIQNNENNVSIKSSIASNNSNDINQEINSYLLKNSYNHRSLIGRNEFLNLDKRHSINIRNSYTPNSNIVNIYPYKTKNFSSIKSKRSPFKVNESFHSIKNSKSQKIKNNNKDMKSNNSLEESSGINKTKNLFNPKKIDIESLSKKNNNNNCTKEKEKVIKDDEMNIEKFQTPSQGSFKINIKKKRCLFCCIPVN